MGHGYKHGAGGGNAGLNFKIINDVPRPTTAAENTIWIDTNTPIAGYHFGAAEPAAPVDNMIWIVTGTTSSVAFNSLKKNSMMIYPLVAKQCLAGTWVDVAAKSYQESTWVDWWSGELYHYGNEYNSITGGWDLSSNWIISHGGTLTKNNDSMVFESHIVDGKHYAKGFLRPNNRISLADVSSLILLTESVSLDNTGTPIRLCVKSTDNAKEEDVVASVGLTNSNTEQTFVLDVSTLNAEEGYYVGIEANATHGGRVVILALFME